MLPDIEELANSYNGDLFIGHFKYPNYIQFTYQILKCRCFHSVLTGFILNNDNFSALSMMSKSQKYITYISECKRAEHVKSLKGEIFETRSYPFASIAKITTLHIRLVQIKELTKNEYETKLLRVLNHKKLFEYVDVD